VKNTISAYETGRQMNRELEREAEKGIATTPKCSLLATRFRPGKWQISSHKEPYPKYKYLKALKNA
jgi:hypothetical protein